MSSERQWKYHHWFCILLLMQGDSQTTNSNFRPHGEGRYSMHSFRDYCLPNLNPSFSWPPVFHLPSTSIEASLHSCFGHRLSSHFFCRPRCVSSLVDTGDSTGNTKSSLTLSQNLLDCCVL